MTENILNTFNTIDKSLFATFICLTILNVVVSTIKSLVTIKCKKLGASIINAIAYWLNTIVTVYLMCDLPLMWKANTVAFCNFLGVFGVKWGEEKARKDRLWKVEVTVPKNQADSLLNASKKNDLTFNYVDIGKYFLFNFYCPTQEDSRDVKDLLKDYNVKYFVSESKVL